MSDLTVVPLYYFCSVAGLAMVLGGIWLIYKQKIYIDRATNQVTEVKTPLGTFKTNIPALALFALGFVPLIYPIVQASQRPRQVRIVGDVRSTTHPVQVYAAVESDALLEDREFSLRVPLADAAQEYRIIYVTGNTVVDELVVPENRDEVRLNAKVITLAETPLFEALGPLPGAATGD